MDILVTFEDGATELRAANSPCVLTDNPIEWTPDNVVDFDSLSAEILNDPRDPGLWVVTDRGGPLNLSHDRIGARTSQLRAWCGFKSVHVWRITGGRGKKEPLVGEWQSCRVETVEEQIARLTQERDAAIAALQMYQDAAGYGGRDLEAAARKMGDDALRMARER